MSVRERVMYIPGISPVWKLKIDDSFVRLLLCHMYIVGICIIHGYR